jgi:protocatechuate 3,4-dioxygenase beta subunit
MDNAARPAIFSPTARCSQDSNAIMRCRAIVAPRKGSDIMVMKKHSRRQFCNVTAGALATLVMAGCSNKESQASDDDDDNDDGTTSDSESASSGESGDESGDASTSGDDSATSSESDGSEGSSESGDESSQNSESSSDSSEETSSTDDEQSSETTSEDESSDTGDSSDTTETTDENDHEDEICKPAVTQLEGPYPQDCPERSDLNVYGHDAKPLYLSGKVYDAACKPVANAIVLIWHSCPSNSGADAIPASQNQIDPNYESAVYDVGTGDMVGKKTPDGQTIPTKDKMYYGWVRTDENGRYVFKTIRPGYYWDNLAPTNRYRCTHIHAKIFIDDNEVMCTQLYFPDDPFNGPDPLYAQCLQQGDCMLRLNSDGSKATFNFGLDV